MSFVYTVSFSGTVTSAGGDTDWLELTPGDDYPCRLLGWSLGQTSEVADAAEEGLRFSVLYLPATVTSGNGSSTTGRPLKHNAPAATFAAETNGTTVATTSGTALTLVDVAWNIRSSPWEFWFPDRDMCPTVRQAASLVFRQQTTLADDMSAVATFFIEEGF